MSEPLTEVEIHTARAEILMAAWDAVPADFRRTCAMAEHDRLPSRAAYVDEPGVIHDFLMALDVADEFVRLARRGYSRRNAELLAVMETRVTWAALSRQAIRSASLALTD